MINHKNDRMTVVMKKKTSIFNISKMATILSDFYLMGAGLPGWLHDLRQQTMMMHRSGNPRPGSFH